MSPTLEERNVAFADGQLAGWELAAQYVSDKSDWATSFDLLAHYIYGIAQHFADRNEDELDNEYWVGLIFAFCGCIERPESRDVVLKAAAERRISRPKLEDVLRSLRRSRMPPA